MVKNLKSCTSRPSQGGNDKHFPELQGGGDCSSAELGEIVFVLFADLLDQTMLSEALEHPGGLPGCFPFKASAQVAVLKSADVEFTTDDGQKEVQVIAVEEVEASIAAFLVLCRPRNLFQVFQRRGGVVNPRDELEIATVAGPHQISQNRHGVDRFFQIGDLHAITSSPMFHPSVVLEKGDIVGQSLDSQDQPVFVIHLDGDLTHMMLNPSSLDPSLKIIAHFTLVSSGELAAKEGSDVLGFNRVDGGPDQFLIDRFQVGLTGKDDISGVFGLHEAPMIPGFKMLADRAKPAGELVQLFMKPLRLDLIGQRLSLIPILEVDKGVVDHLETNLIFPELGRQFTVAVVIELKAEGRPGGHTQIAKSQIGIDEIKIVMQALALVRLEKSLMSLFVMPGFVGRARLHGRKNMNQARVIASLLYDPPDTLFFAKVLFADEFDRKTIFLGQPLGIGPDFLSQGLGPPGIVENPDVFGLHESGHSSRITDAGDGAGDDHPVETGQVAPNLGGVTVGEKFHDVPFLKQVEEPLLQIRKAA
jgi:hypothetical protein